MKIAILANFSSELTPSSSGGTEVFTYSLAEELAKRPSIESIHVYGVGANHFTHEKINFISLLKSSAKEFIGRDSLLTLVNNETKSFLKELQDNLALKLLPHLIIDKYDVIHNNSTSSIINSIMQYISTPTVTTIHTNVDSPSILIPYKLNILQKETNNYFVTIANHQISYAKNHDFHLNIIATVYNGIDVHNFNFRETTNNQPYGLWIGRIYRKHNKGLKEALIASNNIGKKLIAATSIDDQNYYEEEIKPLLTPNITFQNQNISLQQKNEYYENALYLLYPVVWEEPFGLVFLEAMACGTPVIAFAHGAVPEIIKDGGTGFIINSSDQDVRGDWIIKKTGIDGLCEAIERISSMSPDQYSQMRRNCRSLVEEHFTIERMVDEYEKVYSQLITSKAK